MTSLAAMGALGAEEELSISDFCPEASVQFTFPQREAEEQEGEYFNY